MLKQNEFKIKKIDYLIFSLFACWCLVDSINGFLLRNNIISISQVFKTIVALIVIARCYRNNTITSFILGVLFYLGVYLPHLAFHGVGIGESVVLVSKFLTSVLFFLYFKIVCSVDESFFKRKSLMIIKWNFIFFSINMILGIWGMGYTAYGGEEGFGSRGFFYAGNELSGVVAAIFPWIFFFIWKKFTLYVYLLSGVCLMYLSYTLSTKSAIIATAILFLMIIYFYGNKKFKIFTILLSLIGIGYIVSNIQLLLDSDLAIIQRFSFFYDRSGTVDALTMGRLDYWAQESNEYFNSDLFSLLLGLGGMRTVEMDPYDAILNCGFLGLLLLIFLYVKGVRLPLQKKYKNSPYAKVVLSSNIVLIAISISAGHILFSSMAGMLIALSNSLLYCKKDSYLQSRKIIRIPHKQI